MNEQQRVVTAVAICMAILFAWQFFFSPPPPTEEPQAQRSEAEMAGKNEPVPVKADTIEQAPGEVAEARESITTPLVRGELSNKDLAITKLELTKYEEAVWVREGDELKQDRTREQPVSLVTASEGGEPKQARLRLDIGGREVSVPFVKAEDGSYSGVTPEGLAVRVVVSPAQDKYALAYAVSISNQGSAAQTAGVKLTLAMEQRGGNGSMFAPAPDQVHGLCSLDGSIKRKALKDVDEGESFAPNEPTGWAGIDRQYFLIAILPTGADTNRCVIRSVGKTLSLDYIVAAEAVQPGTKIEKAFTVYAGPKRDTELEAVSPLLKGAIDYSLWGIPLGFLARPMVWLMNQIHDHVGSWGIAIIALTFLVKLLLFPVTYKSVASMRKMQLLKPELDRIKKQYENDKERQQLEQMKLFREKGVNPVGGCLPMLLQMPVWFALYRMLWSSVDLYHQPFLWIRDLTHAETFPIMAILVGGLTFVQQKTSPQSMDNQQMKVMMYMMPVMFSVFLIALPSGLVLYILVNSILTIVQQLAINRRTSASS